MRILEKYSQPAAYQIFLSKDNAVLGPGHVFEVAWTFFKDGVASVRKVKWFPTQAAAHGFIYELRHGQKKEKK
jgi:hypothetical protein